MTVHFQASAQGQEQIIMQVQRNYDLSGLVLSRRYKGQFALSVQSREVSGVGVKVNTDGDVDGVHLQPPADVGPQKGTVFHSCRACSAANPIFTPIARQRFVKAL